MNAKRRITKLEKTHAKALAQHSHFTNLNRAVKMVDSAMDGLAYDNDYTIEQACETAQEALKISADVWRQVGTEFQSRQRNFKSQTRMYP